jgi:KDO2-lipid IV(A) lauroyltransferase
VGQARKRPRWLLEYAGLYLLFRVGRSLPEPLLYRLGRAAGLFAFRVLRIRRGVTLGNLRAALGGRYGGTELRGIAERAYANLGCTLMEFCRLYDLPRERIVERVTFSGLEHLDACVAEGRGALLVTGHYGNWELLGAAVAARGYRVSYVVKNQSNPWVDRLQNEIRRRGGLGVIRQEEAARRILQALRRGEFVGILGDQDAGNSGIFVDFLGRPASVARGIATFAWRTGRPIIPVTIVRGPDGRHHAEFTAPIRPDPARRDEEEAIAALTRAHTRRLEQAVLAHPDHYFWVHKRWKTQPPPRDPA